LGKHLVMVVAGRMGKDSGRQAIGQQKAVIQFDEPFVPRGRHWQFIATDKIRQPVFAHGHQVQGKTEWRNDQLLNPAESERSRESQDPPGTLAVPSLSVKRRLFIAIDLPKPVRWRLSQLVADPPRGVRPVRPAQLHLTLHFLGAVEDDTCSMLRDALAVIRGVAFRLSIRGTGVFPPRGRPSVLWAGVDDSPELVELHAAIGKAIASCGLEIELRPYVPHVTLARLTPAVPRAWTASLLAETSTLVIDDVPVDGFHLYHSRTLDGATVHSIVATFPLQKTES
jgi:2'-5' RNA ligase